MKTGYAESLPTKPTATWDVHSLQQTDYLVTQLNVQPIDEPPTPLAGNPNTHDSFETALSAAQADTRQVSGGAGAVLNPYAGNDDSDDSSPRTPLTSPRLCLKCKSVTPTCAAQPCGHVLYCASCSQKIASTGARCPCGGFVVSTTATNGLH